MYLQQQIRRSIVSQVKTQEFEAEIKSRLDEIEKQNATKQEAEALKLSQEFQGKLNSKEIELSQKANEIAMLQTQINSFNQTKQLELDAERSKMNEEIARLKKKDEQEYQLEIKNLELKKQQMAEEKRQFEESQKLKQQQLAEEKRQFNEQMAYQKEQAKKNSGSGSTSSSKGSSSSKNSTTFQKNQAGVNKSASNLTWDSASVLALGMGPLSSSAVENMVKQGKLTVTQKGNKLYVKKSSAWQSIEKITKNALGFTPSLKAWFK